MQKLAYFLQQAGEDFRLTFKKQRYRPYSEEVKHALNRMEGHFIRGVGDGVMEAEIEPDEAALKEADAFLARTGKDEIRDRVQRVAPLIDGFQTPYGMELLATVHWVATNEAGARDPDTALAAIQNWNPRKKLLMKPTDVAAAWQRLQEGAWIAGKRPM